MCARCSEPCRSGSMRIMLFTFARKSSECIARVLQYGAAEAWGFVEDWLGIPTVWIPGPTERHADVLGSLVVKYSLAGNLVPDGHLAALAIEHGLQVCSADTGFARFSEIRWHNPVAG